MKALQIEKPGVYSFSDITAPVIQPDEVLIKIVKVGLCGSDLNTYRGKNPIVTYPRIPGHEISGRIMETGTAVPEEFQVGDKVSVLPYTSCGTCWSCLSSRPNACRNNQTLGVQRDGALTEYLAVPFTKLVGGVNDLSYNEIVMIEPLSIGFHAAGRANIVPGDVILVFGCGLVGLGAVTKAALSGNTVIAVDIDSSKLELAKKCGASHVIHSIQEDLEQRVSEISAGHGPSVVIEAIGNEGTFTSAVDIASFSGRVVYVGYAKNPVSYETKKFILKELDIRGSRNAVRADFNDVLTSITSKTLPIPELITQEYSFDQAGDALVFWDKNPGKVTKIIISCD